MAAYAESHSIHPIAKSIREAFDQEVENERIKDYQEISGQGIKAVVDDKEILAGNTKLMNKEDIEYQKVDTDGTIVYLAIDNKYAGHIKITDELKKDSQTAFLWIAWIVGIVIIGIMIYLLIKLIYQGLKRESKIFSRKTY